MEKKIVVSTTKEGMKQFDNQLKEKLKKTSILDILHEEQMKFNILYNILEAILWKSK